MRIELLVAGVLLAGACVVEEPVGELDGVSWSEAETDIERTEPAEPDIGSPPPRSNCTANYQGCLSSGIGGAPRRPARSQPMLRL